MHSLDGFGCGEMTAALGASGAVLHYLGYQLRRPTDHLRRISVRATENAVLIDQASQRNLDLVDSRGGVKLSLLGTLDRTSTPMGARKLRDWLLHPLCDLEKLLARQEVIAVLLQEPYLMSKLRESLKNVRDMERLTGRISQGAGNARDLQALASSLSRIPALRDDLESLPGGGEMLESIRSRMGCFDELVDLLQRALVEEPPVTIKEGGIIREGYHAGLDELRLASRDGKEWLARLQEKERKRTGIDSLKIRFNNVFGYYIEVTKSHYDKVPPDYQRKQTLVNAERFITPELKQMENTILGADERSRQVEYEQFLLLREEVGRHIDDIQMTADAMADLDVLLGLAEGAQQYRYCRPVLDNSMTLRIVNGRHPVIEQNVSGDVFVPNDAFLEPEENRLILLTGPNMAGKSTYIRQVALITLMAQIGAYRYCRPVLDNSMTLRIVNGRHPVIEQNVSGDVFVPNDAFLEPEENRLILLTGPNMAGKSTYIRQVALITLMAQIGAYVPAEAAHIGLVDRIFCRVGASDDLARGQSTFMVEMSETSLILNNATERSLIILDEIGRGTATFDGLSIAWAVAEYLHDELKSRTLFATHYHELTDLANSRQGVQNYNVAVREWKEEIVFLRKIVPGAADKSYGIQVARLAGMPAVIVDRAKAILSHLEMNSTRPRKKGRSRLAEPRAKNTDMDDDMPAGEYAQLELF